MTFPYRQLLNVAKTLATPAKGESFDRSAINRAYYSAYGEASALAHLRGWTWNGKGASHQQLWAFFKSGGNATTIWERSVMKAIGDAGAALKEVRTRADYRPQIVVSSNEAQSVVRQAENLVKRIVGMP